MVKEPLTKSRAITLVPRFAGSSGGPSPSQGAFIAMARKRKRAVSRNPQLRERARGELTEIYRTLGRRCAHADSNSPVSRL